jgi:hypothetical protein
MHPGFSMCCCKCCWVDQNVDKVSVKLLAAGGGRVDADEGGSGGREQQGVLPEGNREGGNLMSEVVLMQWSAAARWHREAGGHGDAGEHRRGRRDRSRH